MYVLYQLRQDAAASLQMIALDAHKRAYNIKQLHPMTSEDLSAPTQLNHCDHHLSNVQHEVIIDNTLTIHSTQQQQHVSIMLQLNVVRLLLVNAAPHLLFFYICSFILSLIHI